MIDGDAIYDGKKSSGGFGGYDGFASSASSAKPFDSLKYAKQEVKSKASGAGNASYEAGDEVTHGKFGNGLVIESDERTVSVMFDSVGLKKLAKDIAPLKKL